MTWASGNRETAAKPRQIRNFGSANCTNDPFRDKLWLGSCTESVCGSSFGLCGLLFSILWRSVRFERAEKTSRNLGYLIDCSLEWALIGFRRFAEAADFSYELERSRSDLIGSNRWIEVEEGFNVPAHSNLKLSEGTESIPVPSILERPSSILVSIIPYLS